MAWNPSVLSFFAFTSATILVVLAGVGWRRRRDNAQTFAALMGAVGLWAVFYGVQLGFTTKAEQLLWQRLALATSAIVPLLLLVFAFQYAGERERLTRGVKALLVGELAVFGGLTLTNPVHHLVWTEATLHTQTVSPILDLQFASGYFVHILIAYLIVTFALWRILSVYFRSARMYRRQSALLLAGAMPAFVSHILFTLKAGPVPGLDLTPFAFSFTGIMYGFALFYFDLLERTPVAHQRAVELTGDGLLVANTDGVVVDANRVARQVYDIEGVGETNVETVTGDADPQRLDGTTTTGSVDGSKRVYDLFVSKLTLEPDRNPGFAIVLRDVTDRDRYEQRLEVANRVLRHNLRNDMNIILGHADLLTERAASNEQAELAEVISAAATDIVTLSEKVRQMVDIEKTSRTEGELVAVGSVLDPLVAEFREEHPRVTLSIECPEDATAAVVSERALTIALRNLIENAAEHNDTAALTVEVTVTTVDDETRIRVADDGSGLPETEQNVLQNHTETPLEHSSGLGLWLTYWIVSTTGGEISVEASPEHGTTVTLSFPTQPSATSASTHPVHRTAVQESP